MWSLVKESIAKRKVNSLSVVLTVALATLSLVALSLVYGGVTQGVALNDERSGAQLVVVPSDAASEISSAELLFTGAPAAIYFDAATAEKIAAGEGILRATVQFFGQTLDESCCSTEGATRLIGIDFATDWTVSSFAHQDLSAGIADNEIVIGCGAGGKLGGTITVLGKTYTVVDVLDPSGSDLDTAILMDIAEARRICGQQSDFAHYWEKYGNPSSLVSCLLLDVSDELPMDRYLNRISSIKGISVIQRSAVVEDSRAQLNALFMIMLVIGVLLVISTVVGLFARFYSCVWERKSELALYRAIGATVKDLRLMICAEMAVLLGTGLVIGLVSGMILQSVLLDTLGASTAFPFVALSPTLTAGVLLAIAALFILIGLGSIAWPLSQISRLQPSVAMQQADID